MFETIVYGLVAGGVAGFMIAMWDRVASAARAVSGAETGGTDEPPLDLLQQTWTVDVPEGRGVPAGKYTILRGDASAATGETDKE